MFCAIGRNGYGRGLGEAPRMRYAIPAVFKNGYGLLGRGFGPRRRVGLAGTRGDRKMGQPEIRSANDAEFASRFTQIADERGSFANGTGHTA